MNRYLQIVMMAIAPFLVGLVVVELILIVWFPVDYLKPPQRSQGDAWRELWHQPSEIPGLNYELVPNKGQYSSTAFQEINSYGMRDTEPQPIQDTSVCRIVVVGDSVTFGFAVKSKETYPSVLEGMYVKTNPNRPVEVLNLGVGAYSSRDEALVIRHRGLAWNPRLIIIGYSLSDPETLPKQPLQMYYQKAKWWQHYNVFRLIAKVREDRMIKNMAQGDYTRYLHARDRDNWRSVVTAFEDISVVAGTSKIPVLLAIFPLPRPEYWDDYPYQDLHQQVSEAGRQAGFTVVDLYETMSQHNAQSLMARPGDPHPSPLGHTLAATALFKEIERHALLQCPES